MQALTWLGQKIASDCPAIHAKRRQSLFAATQALFPGQRLTLTRIGRALSSSALVKHNIKRVDRLLGNLHLAQERQRIYATLATLLITPHGRPLIIVDGSDLGNEGEEQLLRASTPAGGRALTLYEELHPLHQLGNPNVHRLFLKRLKRLLPKDCHPIVITDAGFRNSWFRSVATLGWD